MSDCRVQLSDGFSASIAVPLNLARCFVEELALDRFDVILSTCVGSDQRVNRTVAGNTIPQSYYGAFVCWLLAMSVRIIIHSRLAHR